YGLDYAHVTEAIFEGWVWSLSTARFHGVEEIVLDRPFLCEFLRHFDFLQGVVADSARLDDIGSEIVNKRSGGGVKPQPITSGMGVDTAEFEHAFRTVCEVAKHRERVG